VVRYHSLAVTHLREPLRMTATAADGTVMGLCHRTRPLHGVQFHPESTASECGEAIVRNFLDQRADCVPVTLRRSPPRPSAELVYAEMPWRDPEHVFVALYAASPVACWLDSAASGGESGRFSFMGVPVDPVEDTFRDVAAAGGDVFGRLDRALAESVVVASAPFPFAGGFVGYIGYETKGGCAADTAYPADPPDAAFIYLRRFLAFDHDTRQAYAAAVTTPGNRAEAQAWCAATARAVAAVAPAPPPVRRGSVSGFERGLDPVDYRRRFDLVQHHLRAGDSYEVNLTYQVTFRCTADHLALYRHLRRANPAPYAAFLRFPEVTVLSSSPERFLRIDSAGRVQAEPIKGTAARHADARLDRHARHALAHDEKTFSENLMVTDLLRNDLGRVCQLGSVTVPDLMKIESYATVHQMVSTVTGLLDPAVSPVECVKAAFPPGSMTGAPKRRTMQIIDSAERGARGVYSGVLGYFSLSGTADFSVVIRTIVARGDAMSIGTGGGVVVLSDADDEYAESQLKIAALQRAVHAACAGLPDCRP
jgi:para-aminobenzoate synthetase